MNQNNTSLDPLELALLKDAEILPRKHEVQDKLEKLLAQTGEQLLAQSLALPWPSMPPKLSRGENYAQQAYRVMDYPRMQQGEGFLFYRTLVLWGHPIGIHLIVSDHFMERLVPFLLDRYQDLNPAWQFAAHDNPWIWEASAAGLVACSSMAKEQLAGEIAKRKFLKLSRFFPLDQYADLAEMSVDCFAELHHQLLARV
ncbi:MAG: hypothetical protein AAFN10_19235 [Bacteroidota bacterium]